MSPEVWKPVVGWEGAYEVSSLGRVRNAASVLIKGCVTRLGYETIRLSSSGKRRSTFVHILVAEAFIGPKPEGREVNHLDGNKRNNAPENLEWVTHQENQRHSYQMLGNVVPWKGKVGERCKSAVLNDKKVRIIKHALRLGCEQRYLARAFSVSQTTISYIANGLVWGHVTV